MKLERLVINNFLRIEELDLDLSASPVHLICGPNEAGKSTIAEAVRFAVLGDSPRVALKKNYPRLVHGDAKKGNVMLAMGGAVINRAVQSGAAEEGLPLDESAAVSARIAFGAQGFVDLKPDERREFLFSLAQVVSSSDEICKRMQDDYEVSPALIERYKPMLKSGFETALKAAQADLQGLRAKWEATTGEKYGSQKAEGWKPTRGAKPPIVTPPDGLERMEAKVRQLQERVEELSQAIGTVSSTQARRQDILRRLTEIRAGSGTVEMRGRLAQLIDVANAADAEQPK